MSDKGDIIINEISEKIYKVLDLENNSCPLNINEDKVFDEIQEIGLHLFSFQTPILFWFNQMKR